MPDELRITRARSGSVPANEGIVVELPLPQIEGLIIIPTFVSFLRNLNDSAADVHVGLAHNRDFVVPTIGDAVGTLYSLDDVWLAHGFDDGGGSYHRDLRGEEMELAGPQSFVVLNGVNNAREYAVVMSFTTKRIGLNEWAAIATRTSFED